MNMPTEGMPTTAASNWQNERMGLTVTELPTCSGSPAPWRTNWWPTAPAVAPAAPPHRCAARGAAEDAQRRAIERDARADPSARQPDGGLASELDTDRSAREWVAAFLDVGRATTDGWRRACLRSDDLCVGNLG